MFLATPPNFAGMAQLVEQLTCNQQVVGSSPITSSINKLQKGFLICVMDRHKPWGCSSVGRALALHARGQEFEPPYLHHLFGLVVQLVRMPACHAGGRVSSRSPISR